MFGVVGSVKAAFDNQYQQDIQCDDNGFCIKNAVHLWFFFDKLIVSILLREEKNVN